MQGVLRNNSWRNLWWREGGWTAHGFWEGRETGHTSSAGWQHNRQISSGEPYTLLGHDFQLSGKHKVKSAIGRRDPRRLLLQSRRLALTQTGVGKKHTGTGVRVRERRAAKHGPPLQAFKVKKASQGQWGDSSYASRLAWGVDGQTESSISEKSRGENSVTLGHIFREEGQLHISPLPAGPGSGNPQSSSKWTLGLIPENH